MELTAPQTITYPPFLIEWFLARTLAPDVLAKFRIRWNGSHIVLPVNNPEGRFVFNKYRRDPRSDEGPKYTYDAGGRMLPYGADRIGNAERVIIAEGEFDALFFCSHGFTAISSTGGAGSFLPEWSNLVYGKEVIICYDNDAAGVKGALKVQRLIPWAKIAVVPEKFGAKDITDYGMAMRDQEKNLKYEIEQILSKARTYNVEEVIAGEDTIAARKMVISIYKDRITKINDSRFAATREYDMAAVRLYDALLQHHYALIEDVQGEIKRIQREKKFGPSKSRDVRSVDAAKAVPIPDFIKFDRQGMAKCLWHDEDTGSMHYIRKSNKIHCFGCSKTADVIEVVMQLNNCSWHDALNKLV